MSKLIALAFSDLHLHKFRNFDVNGSRLSYSLNVIKYLGQKAQDLGVPLLFSGDLYHAPKEVDNEVMSSGISTYHQCIQKKGVSFYAISGNHDLSEKNSMENRSPSHLDSFTHMSSFHKLDDGAPVKTPKFTIWGLPYMNNDLDLKNAIYSIRGSAMKFKKDFKILLLHSDCPGAKTPEGTIINETEHIPTNLDEFFKDWDLVLFGHIHKPQQLSQKCYMLGSPIHQTAGDAGTDMGYWEVYSDGKMKFKHLNNAPKFIKLKKGEEATNTFDYFVAYEQVLEDEDVEVGEFNLNFSRKKLAKRFCKIRGIKNKDKRNALIKILNQVE